MKVGIDLTCITTWFDGGKDQVIYNLLRGFRERGHEQDLVVFAYDFLQERVREIVPGAALKLFRRLRSGKKLFQDLPLRTFVLPSHTRALGLDVLLFPKPRTGLHRFHIPTVVIPHDIQFKTAADRYPLSRRLRDGLLYGMDFRLRDRIVGVSDFDAEEIRRFYPQWAAKVIRIYNPIRFAENVPLDPPSSVARPYLLAINIAYPHKNVLTLLRAFEILRGRIPHDLVLVGKLERWNRYLPEYVAQHNLGGRVIFPGYVDEQRVRSLLQNAAVYVNPSLYEGFGMTPIEAMGAGVPVVSTRRTAIFETTRGLAEYYDPPEDPQALATRLLGVLAAPPDRAARERSQQVMRDCYDYRVIADEYWRVFRGLAGHERQGPAAATA